VPNYSAFRKGSRDCAGLNIIFSLPCGEEKGHNRRVKHWKTTLAILAALYASLALADDFKTIDGKEYKNAKVSRVEPDGIVLKSKSGISKVYFTELPKEVQERFHSKPAQAATAQPDVQERLHNKPAQPAAAQPKPAQIAQPNAETRRADERRRQEQARFARENSNSSIGILFVTILVIAILVTGIIATVAAVNAKKRREKRALLVKQAQEFIDGVKQKLTLPVVSTDIMLKPDEKAVYSSSSVLYETRAVREYRAVHSGVRVAKGVYIGGTSGRSLSTQQWAKLDTGCLTITNKRVVFVGTKEERAFPLDKVISVDPNLTAVVVSVEGRQKAMAFEVGNSLIVMTIIRIASKTIDPSNVSRDKIDIPSLQ